MKVNEDREVIFCWFVVVVVFVVPAIVVVAEAFFFTTRLNGDQTVNSNRVCVLSYLLYFNHSQITNVVCCLGISTTEWRNKVLLLVFLSEQINVQTARLTLYQWHPCRDFKERYLYV